MPLTRRTFALATLLRTCFASVLGTTSRAWAQALEDADGGFAEPLVGHTNSTAGQHRLRQSVPHAQCCDIR